jgi:uncharacterized protein YbjT (DUF2867 family)
VVDVAKIAHREHAKERGKDDRGHRINGNVGGPLIAELAAMGVPTRALVHTPEKAGVVEQEGVEVMVGDFGAPETLDAALEGAERAFLLTPPDPRQPEWEKNFVEAAERTGVRHVVKLSAQGADADSPMRIGRIHSECERLLKESDMAWTFLRPSIFMQTTLAYAGQVAAEGRFYAPLAEAKTSMIDARDVAAVAARALTEAGHEGQVHELTGSEAISHRDIAEKLSAVLGRPVEHVEVSMEDAGGSMVGMGMPEWLAEAVAELFEVRQEGYLAGVTNTVAGITGREPRSYEEFARDHKGAFSGAPTGS